MYKISPKLWLLLTALFALALTTFALSYVVTAPWHEMPELGADGGKNIYTYLYHALYGKGIWFEGMNYPYGEHIVYTDGQPLLSVTLSYLTPRVSIGAALTIMWWLVAATYVLSIIYCFKILLNFKVQPFIAMCFSGLITIFSPQLFRISGHYALSYACVIPMLFYWTLQYHNSSKYRYLLYVFALGVLTTFLHPYYAAVSLVWAGCYTAGYFVTKKEPLIAKLKHVIPLLVSVFAVFVVFGIVMKLTDPATDRPTTPFGILANCTGIKEVIASVHSPIWAFIKGHTKFKGITEGGEGRSYIGIVVMLAVSCAAAQFLTSRFKAQKEPAITHNTFPSIWLFMAVMALLFGMGAPFTWHMEWLLDYASMLKQFRTLGRFSWIFYYIITIYGAVVIYNLYAKCIAQNRRLMGNAILISALGLWSFEASGYIDRTHKKLEIGYNAYDTFVSTGQMNWETFLHAHNFKKEDFQATLVLPFFEVGSEKLWVGNSDENMTAWAIAMGIQAGIQLHLPMIDGMMSRTSWDVAFKQVKIVGGPHADKRFTLWRYTDKPILLVSLDMATLSPDERYLFSASELIGKFQNCSIYACYPGRVSDSDFSKQGTWGWKKFPIGDSCVHYTGNWMVNHYDSNKNCIGVYNQGAIKYSTSQNPVIAYMPVIPLTDMQLYEFSCWFKVSESDYKSSSVIVEVLDSAGNFLSSKKAMAKESVDNNRFMQDYEKSDAPKYVSWLRNNVYFNLPLNARFVRCLLEDIPSRNYEAFDELMIRPADAQIITKYGEESSFMINNHIYFHYE